MFTAYARAALLNGVLTDPRFRHGVQVNDEQLAAAQAEKLSTIGPNERRNLDAEERTFMEMIEDENS